MPDLLPLAPETSKWKKVVFTIVGTLILGAIGSGLWERLFDPAYVWIRDGILNLATFGIRSLKNEMYQNVARGIHQEAAIFVMMMATASIATLAISIGLIILVGGRRRLVSSADDFSSKKKGRLVSIVDRLFNSRAMAILVILYAVMIFFVGYRINYCDLAIIHYNQVRAIIKPLVAVGAVDVFDAEFAQITSSEEYKRLIQKMERIAQDRGQRVPDFQAW
jgi:hypothetical protein